MYKRPGILIVLAATVFAVFAIFAPAANAEEDGRGEVAQPGRGALSAHGTGLVALKGGGEVYVNANRGILLVKDLSGDAVVRVEGVGGSGSWNGFEVYFGTGEAYVEGRDVAVIVVGTDIDLRAHGKGWAYLKGHGHYFVNGFGPFRWDPNGGFAAVDDGAADPPPESE
jgi:hypothetical protein